MTERLFTEGPKNEGLYYSMIRKSPSLFFFNAMKLAKIHESFPKRPIFINYGSFYWFSLIFLFGISESEISDQKKPKLWLVALPLMQCCTICNSTTFPQGGWGNPTKTYIFGANATFASLPACACHAYVLKMNL